MVSFHLNLLGVGNKIGCLLFWRAIFAERRSFIFACNIPPLYCRLFRKLLLKKKKKKSKKD